MELAEAVAVVVQATAGEKEVCDKRSDPTGWKAKVAGYAGSAPSAAQLLQSMKDKKRTIPEMPDKKGGRWDVERCNKNAFPFQTHHLIPKKYLGKSGNGPGHGVCVWLVKNYKDPEYQLEADNNYDTDHANNGYCMPFASTTYQWKNANEDKKEAVAFELMYRTGIQLHQGSHVYESFDKGEEEDDLETSGYLEAADELLKTVQSRVRSHVDRCSVCKKEGKKKIPPRLAVVKYVDGVSGLMKRLIDYGEIFVSERAYNYWRDGWEQTIRLSGIAG